jgi:murein DD-endopeptidase MepM/ murein hydrolase activator NlpD
LLFLHLIKIEYLTMIENKKLLGLVAIVLILVFGFVFLLTKTKSVLEDEVEFHEMVLNEFGMCDDIWDSEVDLVKPNQTLSQLFAALNISQVVGHEITTRMVEDSIFDPRRFRAGRTYIAYFDKNDFDSIRQPRHFFYEINNIDFLHVNLDDTLVVRRGQKEVTVVPKVASGLITSSLWNAISAQGAHHDLALRMSEIFAWEIDFFRIQKGDGFKVIYSESYVGDKSIGISSIDAVYFNNYGRDLFGFYFEADTIAGFFNEKGESLRKAFLRAPLEYVRISSRYSASRLHPVLGVRRPHFGTDYAAPHGTPILAVGDGVVTQAAYGRGNGNFVRIRHNSVYETQYLHMSRFAKGIRPGTRVRQGEVIGYVGATGLATGPHVCFRFWKNGQQVDHLREEFPSAEPLPEQYTVEFSELKNNLKAHLDKIEMIESSTVDEEDEYEINEALSSL